MRHFRELETEATETQVWCEVAYFCRYINEKTFVDFDDFCDHIGAQFVRMSATADRWTRPTGKNARTPTRPHADT